MKKLFLVFALFAVGLIATACTVTTDDPVVQPTPPTILGAGNVQVPRGIPFDPLEGVTATDAIDGDLTADIVVTGEVDVLVEGAYTLTYTVENSAGLQAVVSRVVSVVVDLAVFEPANGTFNYRFADADLRHTLFAAAERYLMETMAGGIPVFANAGFVMYSSRLQLPVDEHIPVMGFGVMSGTMSEDDSQVLMDDGQPGNPGEYTYRSALGQNPDTLNHWEYTDATSSDVITLFLDSLYYFRFNDTLDGYVVDPSMASALPQPVEPEVLPTGAEVATVWQISLREDLVWTYHPNTDTSEFPEGHEVINAHTFVDTYRVAIENSWFRATSGGGHFWSASQEIVNAQLYHDTWDDDENPLAWEEVGINIIDDYTFEFEFTDQMDEWAVTYWLSSFVMTPINFAIYDSLDDPAQYGTTVERTAYNGRFFLDYYEPDVILRYIENPNFHDPDRTFFTHYTYAIIDEALIRFQEFLAGKLDGVGVPAEEFEGVQDDPRIRRVPGATTFRIMINGLETPERQQEEFEGSTYIPEPILGLTTMKQAMFFAIDRQTLAEEVLVTSQTQMFYFTSAYMVEPLAGVPFRNTPQGESVGVGLSPETFGFNSDVATLLFKEAVAEAIALGYYEPGTPGDWTEIEIELLIFSGSEAQVSFGNFIKDSFEEYFVDDENYVRVIVDVDPRAFPGIYFDYMMTGEFDISIGGISGSTLNAASFLDVFADDNRGGFTLNWGIDTSTANIPVTYFDFEADEFVNEIWSFNALVSALNGTVTVVDGQEAPDEAPDEE